MTTLLNEDKGITLDYQASRRIAICFLQECRSVIEASMNDIHNSVESKSLSVVDLDDLLDYKYNLDNINKVLEYLGENNEI